MTALKPKKNNNISGNYNLFKDYPYFDINIYQNIKKITDEFFGKDISLRFISISKEENILFYGDEYFVNKIPVTKLSDIKIRISANAVSSLLDNTLGASEIPFELKKLTDIEARLIKSYTVAIYNSIENQLIKTELNKKVIENAKEYDFTFYVRINNEHAGKIILSIPEYMLNEIEPAVYEDKFSFDDFKKVKVLMNIIAGSSKITLNEIKAIEEGDIILLENSDINKMSVEWEEENIYFRINPNPSLIINVDKNGGNHMEDETSSKSQNMWDSILVDIVAEFDNVKLTLGELKQISEGLVLDLGSVYDNKIKLRVENQTVASGELVILNDRYGVRINSVIKNKGAQKSNSAVNKSNSSPENQSGNEEKDKENFDYSDFEIEDESI